MLALYVCDKCGFMETNPLDFPTRRVVDGKLIECVCHNCTPTVEITCTHGRPTFAVCPHCLGINKT